VCVCVYVCMYVLFYVTPALLTYCRYRVIGEATRYGLDVSGSKTSWIKENFSSPFPSGQTAGRTQLLSNRQRSSLSRGQAAKVALTTRLHITQKLTMGKAVCVHAILRGGLSLPLA
jgi:hypothetical protein